MSNIIYKTDVLPSTEAIIKVYQSSGIRRPVDDLERMEQIYKNSNLIITAWVNEELVGVARSVTDFNYCCYLSDLAVKANFQKMGIGKALIEMTKSKIGDRTMLLLLSAPSAMDYYPKVGFEEVNNGFIIKRKY